MRTLLIGRYFAAAAFGLTCLTVTSGAQAPSPSTPRIGDTPIIHEWIAQYDCPQSASRLPPIRVDPPAEFSDSEACAVVWRARDAWKSAPPNRAIDLRDTLRISAISIEYSRMLVAYYPDTTFRVAQGFGVYFEKAPDEPTIIVGINRNTGETTVGRGHPFSMRYVTRAEAFPEFAGLWSDSAGNLHVALTDVSRADSVRSLLNPIFAARAKSIRDLANPNPAIIIEKAVYNHSQLQTWWQELDRGLGRIKDVHNIGVDDRSNCVHVGAVTAVARARAKNLIARGGLPAKAFCVVRESRRTGLH